MSDYRATPELAELLKALSDDTIYAQQHAQLEALLLADRDARTYFRRYMALDALLLWRLSPAVQAAPLPTAAAAELTP